MKRDRSLCLAITSGDPAGIGPDVALAALAKPAPAAVKLVLLGDRQALAARAKLLRLPFSLPDYEPNAQAQVSLLHLEAAARPVAGKPDEANAGYVLAMLERAHALAASGACAGIVTAPLSKAVIAAALPGFRGHTGHLARLCGSPKTAMAFVGPRLRAVLATEHLPLAEVPAAISVDGLLATLLIADAGLAPLFAPAKIKWQVCGLNPHAGEGGILGLEDEEVIRPAIEAARRAGLDASGPLPADTVFLPAASEARRCVLAMYHDQALPVLKRDSFAKTVNLSLGLPYVRSSPDHGTAFGLAGSGHADSSSMRAAIDLAVCMARHEAAAKSLRACEPDKQELARPGLS